MTASDVQLARYRRDGLSPINPAPPEVARRRPRRRDGFVEMHRDNIAARLAALDWMQTFDLSEDAQRERVRLAVQYVGRVALESDVRDDGHWGGYQARDAGTEHRGG